MKKTVSAILALVLSLLLVACGEKTSEIEIPDVFGVNYTDAIKVLEAEGFEVSAIESSVDSFSDKLLYPLEKVDKGAVFKIDEYILDNNGNINKNYDAFYDEGLVSNDKSVVIYYAKEDYALVKDVEEKETTPSTQSATEPAATEAAPTEPAATEPAPTQKADDGALRSDFKEAMDAYEAAMNEYADFMEKYQENPTDLSLLKDYPAMMEKFEEAGNALDAWDSEDMNAAELAYYTAVVERVNKRLLSVGQ